MMKLDRNIPGNSGHGKYALLKLRKLALCESTKPFERFTPQVEAAIKVLEENGILDWGEAGTESEFMVIRLKDKYAEPALRAYANAACEDDEEWADEIEGMADRSGLNSPFCKKPD